MFQWVKCNFLTVTPKNCGVCGVLRVLFKMKLEDGCCLLITLPSSYRGLYPRHRAGNLENSRLPVG